MKKLISKTLCIMIAAVMVFGMVNVFARENRKIPDVLTTQKGIFYITGAGSLRLYNRYDNTDTKIMDDVIHIGCGYTMSNHIAIQSDGTLHTLNDNYQENFTYVAADMADAKSTCFQDFSNFILTNEGELYSDGLDVEQCGILGLGEGIEPNGFTRILDNVDSIDVNFYHAAALKRDNTLWLWGHNSSYIPEKAADNIVSIEALTPNAVYALKADNSVWMGEYENDDEFYYTPNFVENVKTLAASNENIGYIDLNGTLHLGFIKTNEEEQWSESHFVQSIEGVKEILMPHNVIKSVSAPVGFVKNDNSLWITTNFDNMKKEGFPDADFVKVMDNVFSVSMSENECAVITNDGTLYSISISTDRKTDAIGQPMVIATQLFDFAPSSWAEAEIQRAITLDLIPRDMQRDYRTAISRVDFCEILTKTIEAKTGKEINQLLNEKNLTVSKTFVDTESEYVDYMSRLGIVSGTSETLFNPYAKITREQAAAMLARTASALGYDTSYNTSVESGVSSWAADGVGFVIEKGIMNGTSNGFEPQGKYTKEQAVLTFVRMYDNLK